MKAKKVAKVLLLIGLVGLVFSQGTSSLATAEKQEEQTLTEKDLDTSKWDDIQIGEVAFQIPKELTRNDLLSSLVDLTSGVGSLMKEEAGVEDAEGTLSEDNFLLKNIKIYQPSDKDYPLTSACIASFTCEELLQYIQDSKEAGVDAQFTSDDVNAVFEGLKNPDYYKKGTVETPNGFTYIRKVGSDSISEFEDEIGLEDAQGTGSDMDSALYIGLKELKGEDHLVYGVFQYEKDEYGKSLVYANKIMNTITFDD